MLISICAMGKHCQTNVGDTVKFKLWVRPYKEVSGTVVKVEKDRDRNKIAKYIIKPDKKHPELTRETTYRFHPYATI